MTHANGNKLVANDGSLIADFPSHWAACAAMIQISDPNFRSLGSPTPFELGWVAGLMGEDPRLCPFDKMTAEWREWQSFHGKAVEYVRKSGGLAPSIRMSHEEGHRVSDGAGVMARKPLFQRRSK